MKISATGRYALRIMLDLALYGTGQPVRIRDIADRQEIPLKYSEAVMAQMNKAGFVTSVRGPKGGYLLAKRPEDYTVAAILQVTEGSMIPVECVESDYVGRDRETGAAAILWKKLNGAVASVLEETTLADLMDWQIVQNGEYFI
ncbi:MAG: Rrf2 family transcriptional regulator [Eubacterium sp.]|nr:Rrf2 family transcriptional regulator [Eubacterium sp.]